MTILARLELIWAALLNRPIVNKVTVKFTGNVKIRSKGHHALFQDFDFIGI